MIITKPAYFDTFRCIADKCEDACCKEWAVQVDDASAAYYRSLPGDLGNRLRQVLVEEDGETVMRIENGRCPMWRNDGLCRIQAELGEEALCHTCAQFPRLTHDYGDFTELGLELSCPEAARIILSAPGLPPISREEEGGEGTYDREAMDVLKATRQTALAILEDPAWDVPTALALLLLYGCQAQSELDCGEMEDFDPESALVSAKELAKAGDPQAVLAYFSGLEILADSWKQRLANPETAPWDERIRKIAGYFINRYWLQAVSDYDLYSRVKFTVISCLTIHLLGGDMVQTAQRYSKEIENSIENVESILDAAYECPAFTDDKLLGMLIKTT